MWLRDFLPDTEDRPQQTDSPEINDDTLFELADGGTIRYADIPRDAIGDIDTAWLNEHCTCGQVHVARGGVIAPPKAPNDDTVGMYL